MRKLALAILIAATPAAAQNAVEFSHEVRFQSVTFTCGQTNDAQPRRFMYATPSAKHLPMYEPLPDDAKAQSWAIVYRMICENAYVRQARTPSPITEAALVNSQSKGARRVGHRSGGALIARGKVAKQNRTLASWF